MASINDRQRLEEYEEEHLIQEYEKIISNPSTLKFAVDYLYDSLLEDAIMTMCFRAHFESKHPEVFGNLETESKASTAAQDYPSGNNSKLMNIKCPNCSKIVSANKFASHLERDMGLGRNSTRIASRKKTTNYEYESESEESDTNWNERKAKKKLSNGRNNGKNSKKYT